MSLPAGSANALNGGGEERRLRRDGEKRKRFPSRARINGTNNPELGKGGKIRRRVCRVAQLNADLKRPWFASWEERNWIRPRAGPEGSAVRPTVISDPALVPDLEREEYGRRCVERGKSHHVLGEDSPLVKRR